MMKSFEDQIEEIMDEFNFHRVHDVMTHLNWRWWDCGEVPSVSRMRKVARDLLKEVSKGDSDVVSLATGGFCAYRYYGHTLKLAFEVTQWSPENEE